MVVLELVLLLVVLWIVSYAVWRRRSTDRLVADERIDGDWIYADDRINEMLYATDPDESADDLDFDPSEIETVRCESCRTLNDASYTYCRECSGEL